MGWDVTLTLTPPRCATIESRQSWFQYAVVVAFAVEPFKRNPGVPPQGGSRAGGGRAVDAVRRRLVQPLQDRLPRIPDSAAGDASTPRFHLRWCTPVAEVERCGHATLASAHFLFTTSIPAKHDMVEFATKYGILTASCTGEHGRLR